MIHHVSNILVALVAANVAVWIGMDCLISARSSGRWLRVYWSGWMFGMLLGLFLLMTQSTHAPNGVLEVFAASLVYLWCMILGPLLLVWILLYSTGLLGRKWFCRTHEISEQAEPSRRDFLRKVVLGASSLGMVGAAVSVDELSAFRIRKLELKFPQLPPGLDGLTIAHLSDLHVGFFTYGNILEQMAEATNELDADLVFMTGDLVNYSLQVLPQGIRLMKSLRGRFGVYLCEGNHDLLENPVQFRRSIREAGLNLLVDQGVTLGRNGTHFRLLGTRWTDGLHGSGVTGSMDSDFVRYYRELIESLCEPGLFHVALTHHPHAWDSAREAGVDLTLSGHTHGGQLMLDDHFGLGPLLFRYWSGLYRHGNSALVVSNGVGSWFPFRIHAPAEVIHLTLRKG